MRGRSVRPCLIESEGMGSFTDNPFAVLTIVVAPAILTNAASILSMGVACPRATIGDNVDAQARVPVKPKLRQGT